MDAEDIRRVEESQGYGAMAHSWRRIQMQRGSRTAAAIESKENPLCAVQSG